MKQKNQLEIKSNFPNAEDEYKKLSKKKKDKIEKVQRIKKYGFINFISKFSFQFYKEYLRKEYKKRSLFLVEMYLRNGKKDTFTISTNEKHFTYKKGLYVIDSDLVIEDIHSNLNQLIYQQDCAIPFKLDFNIDSLSTQINAQFPSIEKALNPKNLEGFISSQVIEKVLKGQELSDEMRLMKLILIINLLVTFIVGILVAKSSGLF